jgi:hypothetical protein
MRIQGDDADMCVVTPLDLLTMTTVIGGESLANMSISVRHRLYQCSFVQKAVG